MNEKTDFTKHDPLTFRALLTIKACEDAFKVLADKWESENPDKPIPEGFKEMVEIQFEFMSGMLLTESKLKNGMKDCPQEFQQVIDESF